MQRKVEKKHTKSEYDFNDIDDNSEIHTPLRTIFSK